MKTFFARTWRPSIALVLAAALSGAVDGQNADTNSESAATTTTVPDTDLVDAFDGPSANTVAAPVTETGPILPAAPVKVSPEIDEIVKLAQARVGDDVILAFVQRSGRAYNPTADEIVYLSDLGLSQAVIAALVGQSPNAAALAAATNPQPVDVAPPSVDETADAAPPAGASEDVSTYYTALSPYGTWSNVPDYGWCWQPTVGVLNVGWQPYCNRGRWIYTTCGWYWQSDYTWGAVAFHYGRWQCHDRLGWVWVPDRCWGPAWVSWRYSSDYCGWAPLPPGSRYVAGRGFIWRNQRVDRDFDFGLTSRHYTFVPSSHFTDAHPHRQALQGAAAQSAFTRTTVANNYFDGTRRTVINEGIGRGRIAGFTGHEVPQYAIQATRQAPPVSGSANLAARPQQTQPTWLRTQVAKPASTATVNREVALPGGEARNFQNSPGIRTTPFSLGERPTPGATFTPAPTTPSQNGRAPSLAFRSTTPDNNVVENNGRSTVNSPTPALGGLGSTKSQPFGGYGTRPFNNRPMDAAPATRADIVRPESRTETVSPFTAPVTRQSPESPAGGERFRQLPEPRSSSPYTTPFTRSAPESSIGGERFQSAPVRPSAPAYERSERSSSSSPRSGGGGGSAPSAPSRGSSGGGGGGRSGRDR